MAIDSPQIPTVSPPTAPVDLPPLCRKPDQPTAVPPHRSGERSPRPLVPSVSLFDSNRDVVSCVPGTSIAAKDDGDRSIVPSTNGVSADQDAPVVPAITVADDDVAQDKHALPPIPSFSFDGPDDDDDDDDAELSSTSPPAPVISFGEGTEQLVGPSISVGDEENTSATSVAHSEHDRPPDEADDGPEPGSASAQRAVASSMPLGGGFCGGCDKILTGGKVIRAVQALWHPKCFRCAHCRTRLEHVSFYVHEGLAYCHVDYHELFSKRCFHCQTPIVDARFIAIDDPQLAGQKQRYYHDLHFFCANCGDPFVDPSKSASAPGQHALEDKEDEPVAGSKPFFTVKGYPYCEHCHMQLHRPKCHACRLPIVGPQLTALGKPWHPECFQCAGCHAVFEGERFFEHKGHPYDEECYTRLLRTLPRTT